MKTRFLFIFTVSCLVVLLPVGLALGQTGKIAGQVTDAETGEALPGVNVVLEGTDQGAATDQNGEYFIVNVTPGTYSLTASIIGYQSITKTGVEVTIDHTTPVNFQLEQTVIEGQTITVEAEREIIKMDQSASAETTTPEEIEQTPLVTSVDEMVNLQAGVEGGAIRGGGSDQITYMQDGLMLIDNRANQPMMNTVNLSQIQNMEVIKGGFNAEYGNVRSGVISVVTREGNPDQYSGVLRLELTPARIKHSGYPVYDPRNNMLKPYMDPEVRMVGTREAWDQETQQQYSNFVGWGHIYDNRTTDADPNNNVDSPEQLIDLFVWQHRLKGYEPWDVPSAEDLGRESMDYGHKPDWLIDGSLGGPVPLIGDYLGNLTFFASHRSNRELWAVPLKGKSDREYYEEDNTSLKLTSRITDNMKLQAQASYGVIGSKAENHRSWGEPDDFLKSGTAPLYTGAAAGDHSYHWPEGYNPFDVYTSTYGISFDHTLSPRTFYKLRISAVNRQNLEPGPVAGVGIWGEEYPGYPDNLWRNMDTLRYFGTTPVDEAPLGFRYQEGPKASIGSDWLTDATAGAGRDFSKTRTYNIKFDLTSQIHPNHMIQTGFIYNYDDIFNDLRRLEQYLPDIGARSVWRQYPVRAGAYLQDKFEFEGMIMNLGVRADYSDANSRWADLQDPYADAYTLVNPNEFFTTVPEKDAQAHLKISPRVGISHPISERSKFYFNYGHFYSMPPSFDLYHIATDPVSGVEFLGNANAEPPRTIAYELGYALNAFNMFMVHISGYYKDITSQTGEVRYTNYDASVNYETVENNFYEDIRGFELRLQKNFGQWITGWANYNFRVEQQGHVGREHYFQDQRQQRIEGLQDPDLEPVLAEPIARANIRFHTPSNFGPTYFGIQPLGGWNLSFLYSYEAGNHFTWDPLQTFELQDNQQWKAYQSVDARIAWNTRIAGNTNLQVYADITNLFNINNLNTATSFLNSADWEEYLKSLHLPQYEGQIYQDAGYTAGSDKPGDVRSEDKPYIDMPNYRHLWHLDRRFVKFGIRYQF